MLYKHKESFIYLLFAFALLSAKTVSSDRSAVAGLFWLVVYRGKGSRLVFGSGAVSKGSGLLLHMDTAHDKNVPADINFNWSSDTSATLVTATGWMATANGRKVRGTHSAPADAADGWGFREEGWWFLAAGDRDDSSSSMEGCSGPWL